MLARIVFCLLVSGAVTAPVFSSELRDLDQIRVIAKSGDTMPGTPGVLLRLNNDFSANEFGDTAFWGYLEGSGISNDNNAAMWSE